jgi:hypothetical protein
VPSSIAQRGLATLARESHTQRCGAIPSREGALSYWRFTLSLPGVSRCCCFRTMTRGLVGSWAMSTTAGLSFWPSLALIQPTSPPGELACAKVTWIRIFKGGGCATRRLNNLDSEFVPLKGCDKCSVHRGFWNAYNSVAATMHETLGYVLSRHPAAEIWVTGQCDCGASQSKGTRVS